MNCTETRRHWMLYLDSEGDAELHLRIREHLAVCPACAAWFTEQERVERAIVRQLRVGEETPELWRRVLTKAEIHPPGVRLGRRRILLGGAIAAAAAILIAVWLGRPRPQASQEPPHLSRSAAEWHAEWERGEVRPDFASTSDREVDRYLKAKAPFRVHCPPRTDVNFAVQGAGIRQLNNLQAAAYIVGRVGEDRVSILVLDRGGLETFPQDRAHLQANRRHHCREGPYDMVAGIVADNVVLVIGTAPPEKLERLLDAYGTYHEG